MTINDMSRTAASNSARRSSVTANGDIETAEHHKQ